MIIMIINIIPVCNSEIAPTFFASQQKRKFQSRVTRFRKISLSKMETERLKKKTFSDIIQSHSGDLNFLDGESWLREKYSSTQFFNELIRTNGSSQLIQVIVL